MERLTQQQDCDNTLLLTHIQHIKCHKYKNTFVNVKNCFGTIACDTVSSCGIFFYFLFFYGYTKLQSVALKWWSKQVNVTELRQDSTSITFTRTHTAAICVQSVSLHTKALRCSCYGSDTLHSLCFCEGPPCKSHSLKWLSYYIFISSLSSF